MRSSTNVGCSHDESNGEISTTWMQETQTVCCGRCSNEMMSVATEVAVSVGIFMVADRGLTSMFRCLTYA